MEEGWTDSASAPEAEYGTICGTDTIANYSAQHKPPTLRHFPTFHQRQPIWHPYELANTATLAPLYVK